MKYHHLGIPTREKLQDERYLPHLKMYVSGYGKSPYGVEWVRYEDDADFPEIVKTIPHVAFEVDDMEKDLDGKNVIIPPNSPSPGVIVAFIEDNGTPEEFIQVDRTVGIELEEMASELIDAGIDVICSQKGHDGFGRAAVCGIETGDINIYTICTVNLSDARSLGFESVNSLDEYRDQACE